MITLTVLAIVAVILLLVILTVLLDIHTHLTEPQYPHQLDVFCINGDSSKIEPHPELARQGRIP